MKILFITPMIDAFSCRWIPLGPGYLSAALKADGHGTALFDLTREYSRLGRSLELLDTAMLEKVKVYQPDIIAFSTVSPAIYDTVRCARAIRRVYRGMIIAGGHHATAMPELTLQKIPELDGVIVGEGVYALADIARGGHCRIPGVLWRNVRNGDGDKRDNQPVPEHPVVNLDELPFPDFSIYDMDYYLARNIKTIRGFYLKTISLMTSRGCRYKCGFCSESLTYGSGVRYNSPEYVMEMIGRCQDSYSFEAIYFHDNDFLSDQTRAERICKLLTDSGKSKEFKWCIQTRADALNPDILKLLKKAGCVKIEIGIESASQKQLDMSGKNLKLDKAAGAVKLCHEAGIKVHGYFISLLPGETYKDLCQITDKVREYGLDSFLVNNLSIHPGTRFYEQYGKRFFEGHEWNEDDIRAYYDSDLVSQVTSEERNTFQNNSVNPLMQKLHRRELLRNNKLIRIINYIINERKNSRL